MTTTEDGSAKQSSESDFLKVSGVKQDFSQLSVGHTFDGSDLQPPGGFFDDSIWESVDTVEMSDFSEESESTDTSNSDTDDSDQSRDHSTMTSKDDTKSRDYSIVTSQNDDVTVQDISEVSTEDSKTEADESTEESVDRLTVDTPRDTSEKPAVKSIAKFHSKSTSPVKQHVKSKGLSYDCSMVEVVDLAGEEMDSRQSKQVAVKTTKETGIHFMCACSTLVSQCLCL